MWSKRKARNRRLDRSHILEVKLRSQQVRARRLRLFSEIAGFCLIMPLIVLALWKTSRWAVDEWVFKNPVFSIRQIDVQTDGTIPLRQIRYWAGVKEGDNLLALDLPKIERDLRLVPWIRAAAVERVLPDALKIRVSERQAVAQVSRFHLRPIDNQIEYKATYLDEAGYVLPALTFAAAARSSVEADALPLLTGIAAPDLRPGRRVDLPRVHAALRFIESFERSPMVSRVDLKAIDVSSPETLVVTTHQQNEITFGLGEFERQLQRWSVVHDYAQRASKAIATLDLSVSNNVPARWQEAGLPIPVRPKSVKPSHAKRKHV